MHHVWDDEPLELLGTGFSGFFKPENPVFTYKVKEKSEVIEYLLEKTGLTKK